MINQEYNYKHIHRRCHECGETKEILYDEHHGIIYCTKCGLILHDTNVCKRNSGT